MESEETGEENRGTSEKYDPRRRSSGKQKRYCTLLEELRILSWSLLLP
jgi:hypothetical protein